VARTLKTRTEHVKLQNRGACIFSWQESGTIKDWDVGLKALDSRSLSLVSTVVLSRFRAWQLGKIGVRFCVLVLALLVVLSLFTDGGSAVFELYAYGQKKRILCTPYSTPETI
jgi:hypothetical protein